MLSGLCKDTHGDEVDRIVWLHAALHGGRLALSRVTCRRNCCWERRVPSMQAHCPPFARGVPLSQVANNTADISQIWSIPLRCTPGAVAARRCRAFTARSLSLREAASACANSLLGSLSSVSRSRTRLFCIVAAASTGDSAPAVSMHVPALAAKGASGPADTVAGCTPLGRAVCCCVNDAAVVVASGGERPRASVAACSGAAGCGSGI